MHARSIGWPHWLRRDFWSPLPSVNQTTVSSSDLAIGSNTARWLGSASARITVLTVIATGIAKICEY